MAHDFVSNDEKKNRIRKPDTPDRRQNLPEDASKENPVAHLQRQIGNRAVQRLLAQRSGDSPYQLDDDTAGRINSSRSSGQSLDTAVQQKMGDSFNADFSSVQVHADAEADQLNKNLSARAFTTGSDIFFREGEYNPHSSSGQELIAHELTHVVQQATGQVENGSGMTVNAPGDRFEQEADAAAKSATSEGRSPGVQRQELDEDQLQMNGMPEEEELQTQEMPEEEELQRQAATEDEEIQTNGMPEEEELAQTKRER